jgi:hypothetical protein
MSSSVTPKTHTESTIEREALALARSVQKEGQTKEQTKLISQGIAKGIELYKRQQSAKSRARDKAIKKQQKVRLSTSLNDSDTPISHESEPRKPTTHVILTLSGTLDLAISGLLFWIYANQGSLTLGMLVVSGGYTLTLALIFVILAIFCFRPIHSIRSNGL